MWKLSGLLLLVLCAPSVSAQDGAPASPRWAKRFWQASLAAVAAGSAVDMASSLGKHETNGLLANRQGVFSAQGVGLKLLLAGAAVGTQQFLLHRHASATAYKTGALVNFAVAGAMGAVAAHNYQIKPVQ